MRTNIRNGDLLSFYSFLNKGGRSLITYSFRNTLDPLWVFQ